MPADGGGNSAQAVAARRVVFNGNHHYVDCAPSRWEMCVGFCLSATVAEGRAHLRSSVSATSGRPLLPLLVAAGH